MLAIKHGCYDTLEIHANRLVMFAIIAIIERQWSYLMKWKQEETTRATEHGHKHTHPPQRRKEVKTQDSRENDWDKKGEMIFDYMTTRKNDIRLQRKTSSRKQQKQNLIALKRAIMSVASYELMSH